jgi:predicted type IV restriction endonuclease
MDLSKLKTIRKKAVDLEDNGLSEADTKRVIIEPTLQLLGWDVLGVEEVKNEYRAKSSDNPVDYGIFLGKKPAFFLEAKSLGTNIDDRKCITQTVAYASNCGTEWAVISNGKDWAIYNALAPVDAEKKLFRKFSIDQEGVEESLSLLQKSSMGEAKIKQAWDMEHAVKQVLQAMRDLTTGRNKTLVGLIRKNTSGLGRGEVESALLQLEISMPTLGKLSTEAGGDSSDPPGRTRRKKTRDALGETATPKTPGKSAISKLQEFFENKWESDPSWFDRYAKHPSITKKTRRFFGKGEEDIYLNGNVPVPPRPISDSGWFFDANLSVASIEGRICAMAKLN